MPENVVAGPDVARIAASSRSAPVAAHIKHILVKLVTPTSTLAAVRAERAGLYVPCVPGLARGEAQ